MQQGYTAGIKMTTLQIGAFFCLNGQENCKVLVPTLRLGTAGTVLPKLPAPTRNVGAKYASLFLPV
jgi:hypothetical protein